MRIFALSALLTALLSGCGDHSSDSSWNGKLTDKIPQQARTALEQATEFELFSLDPDVPDPDHPKEEDRHKSFGSILVKDAPTRAKILAALDAGASSDKASPAMCFEPRHAIRVLHAGKSYLIVICFECNWAKIYIDDQPEEKGFGTTNSPETAFDEVLRTARIPLAKKTHAERHAKSGDADKENN
jgi:hypothetical protein